MSATLYYDFPKFIIEFCVKVRNIFEPHRVHHLSKSEQVFELSFKEETIKLGCNN